MPDHLRKAQAGNTPDGLLQRSWQRHDHSDECSSGFTLESTGFAVSAFLGKAHLLRLCHAPNVGKMLDKLATTLAARIT
jgi:hypothetical protein